MIEYYTPGTLLKSNCAFWFNADNDPYHNVYWANEHTVYMYLAAKQYNLMTNATVLVLPDSASQLVVCAPFSNKTNCDKFSTVLLVPK